MSFYIFAHPECVSLSVLRPVSPPGGAVRGGAGFPEQVGVWQEIEQGKKEFIKDRKASVDGKGGSIT